MKEGDVILAQIPQADRQAKIRPAIILRELPFYRDFLVCGLSTQLHQQIVDFDEIISSDDDDFISSGLIAISVIRLGFLGVVSSNVIAGTLGSISVERHKHLLQKLSDYLTDSK
ncbi:MAG: type II toxin-antitoxin system PemK/MazF family toxin [Chloroflexia bacterium]